MNTYVINSVFYKNRKPSILSIPLLKGIIIIIWGILALLLANSQQLFLIRSFGVLNIVTFVITVMFMLQYKHLVISDQWVKLEAIIEFMAGILFTFVIKNMEEFTLYISIGIIFIIMLQFIYGYMLLNSGKYNMPNIIMRFVTLIVGAIISIAIFAKVLSFSSVFIIIGLFSILYGIINIHFGLSLNNAIFGQAK